MGPFYLSMINRARANRPPVAFIDELAKFGLDRDALLRMEWRTILLVMDAVVAKAKMSEKAKLQDLLRRADKEIKHTEENLQALRRLEEAIRMEETIRERDVSSEGADD